MKKMKLLKFLLLAVIVVSAYSCFDDDPIVDPINYTAAREDALLDEYLDTLMNRGYDLDTTDLGVYYSITKEGEGDFVQTGDSIGVNYQGFRPDNGRIFDASAYNYADSIWKFTFTPDKLISGFDDALMHLNKGAEGVFVIPSDYAYGATGYGSIPPYTTLTFIIKLEDIYE
jgi:FKBP-type peptidyl-prolyl cis-trans isomerase FkpA